MKINNKYVSAKNSYSKNKKQYIVIHNTDNFKRTATAEAHAKAQQAGHLAGISAHVYVDDIAAYKALYYKFGAWHVGVNYGTGNLFGVIHNQNSLAIEICCYEGIDYEKAFQNAVDVCKQLMKKYKISADHVVQHYDVCSKNCPSQIRARGDWDRFQALIRGEEYVLYRVRKSWEDADSQLNAYTKLENAKAEAEGHPGYNVYDASGRLIYAGPPPDTLEKAWLDKVAATIQKVAAQFHILPSVLIAQSCLETGFGKTDLAKRCNVYGLKADLINNTWKQWTTWNPEKTYSKKTPEVYNGVTKMVDDVFRVYDSIEQCTEDYCGFLLHVRNDAGYKYNSIQGMTDPAKVIRVIHRSQNGTTGYCTDPDYEEKILSIISRYDLTKYDNTTKATDKKTEPEKDRYVVRRKWAEKKYQIGTYHDLNTAKKAADENWLYKVYDLETHECIYKPQLTILQAFIACMIWFDLYVRDDIAKGLLWWYFNSKPSLGSFWATRKAGKRWCNCSGAVFLALYAAGVPKKALRWYGGKNRIVFLDAKAEADAKEWFDFIKIGNKTVKQCEDDGTMVPGDVLTYVGFGHTNAYVMKGFSFDAGHLWCKGTGEGAEYTKWLGPLAYGGRKVAYIVRLKKEKIAA